MNNGKGIDPYTHGNSFANGPRHGQIPDWQMAIVRESQVTFWKLV